MKSLEKLLFVVLVPHRDVLPALETYRRTLFAAGIDGAFSFPSAAPLALLKRPLEKDELKSAAVELRKQLGAGKIVSAGQAEYNGWNNGETAGEIRFFGIVLEMPAPVFPPDAVNQLYKKPILAPAIIPTDNPDSACIANNIDSKVVPDFSFRAAALANLTLQPVHYNQYSFTWNMGPLFWLPNIKKRSSELIV